MFSKSCQYAIRAIIYISIQSKKGNKVSIKEVSNEVDSPEHFTAKILQKLSRKNFIKSTKGPKGGFYLDEEDMNLSLIDIVREIDGDQLFVGCGLGLKACSDLHPCPIHEDYKKIKMKLICMLENYKIGMLLGDDDLKSILLK
nr:Rrf2 family transcriptional regulator [uncultured Flavobacterium sp.]